MISYLALGRMGRFANGLFQIAGSIGIAVKSGQDYRFPKWINWDAKERFGSTEDIEVYKYFVNPLPELPEGIDFRWNNHGWFWGYKPIELKNGNWNLEGHFQSDKYFLHCMDHIRFYFTMFNEVEVDGIALHYRAGDYSEDQNGYHPRCTLEYYYKALEHLPKEMMIFLFSDNLEEAGKIMAKLGRQYIPVNMNYIDSFRMMKKCKHFICANSSYSLMAAILADNPDKIVITPKRWFGEVAGLDSSDVHPENSIVI